MTTYSSVFSPGLKGSKLYRTANHKRSIISWVNSAIPKELALSSLSDLFTTPLALVSLLEHVGDCVIPGVIRAPTSSYEQDRNFRAALGFLEQNDLNVGRNDYLSLVQNGEQGLLELLWNVAEHFVIRPQFGSPTPSACQAGGEAVLPTKGRRERELWVRQAGKWTSEMTSSLLPGLELGDMSAAFSDGSILLAIIAQAWPEAGIDWEGIRDREGVEESVEVAMSVAEQRWGVTRIVEARSVVSGEEDDCLLLYLALLARKLPSNKTPTFSSSDARTPLKHAPTPVEAGRVVGPEVGEQHADARRADADAAPPALDALEPGGGGGGGGVEEVDRKSAGGKGGRWGKLPWLICEKEGRGAAVGEGGGGGEGRGEGGGEVGEGERRAELPAEMTALARELAGGDAGMARVLAVLDDIGGPSEEGGGAQEQREEEEQDRERESERKEEEKEERESERKKLPVGIYKSLEPEDVKQIQRMLRGELGDELKEEGSGSESSWRDTGESGAESDDEMSSSAIGRPPVQGPDTPLTPVDIRSTLRQAKTSELNTSGDESTTSELAAQLEKLSSLNRQNRAQHPAPTSDMLAGLLHSRTQPALSGAGPGLASTLPLLRIEDRALGVTSGARGGEGHPTAAVTRGKRAAKAKSDVPWCGSCKGAFNRPRLLDCLHMLCLPCLQPLVRRPPPSASSSANRSSALPFVVCPTCSLRTPVPNGDAEMLDPDEGTSALVRLLRGREEQPCDNCLAASPAIWCGSCQAALCTLCSDELHSFKFTKAKPGAHNTVPIAEAAHRRPRPNTCPLHPTEALAFLSVSQQQLICKECVLSGGHDKDRYVHVAEAGAQARDDLAEMASQLRDRTAHVQQALDDVQRCKREVEDGFQNKIELVHSRTEELLEALHAKSQVAEQEVTARRDARLKQLQAQALQVGNKAKAIRQAALMIRVLMANANAIEVLRFSEAQTQMLSALHTVSTLPDPALEQDVAGTPPQSNPRSILKSPTTSPGTEHWPDGPRAVSRVMPHMAGAMQLPPARPLSHPAALPPPRDHAPSARASDAQQPPPAVRPAVSSPVKHGAPSPNGRLNPAGSQPPSGTQPSLAPPSGAGPPTVGDQRPGRRLRWVGSLHALGGFDGASNSATMERLQDDGSHKWVACPSLPGPRRGLAAVAYQGRIFVVGGWNGREYLDSSHVYDTATDKWVEGRRMLCPRCFAGAAIVQRKLHVVGGYFGATNLASGEAMDLETGEWEALPSMAVPRRGLGVGGVGCRLVVAIGGWNGKENVKSVEAFDVVARAWFHLAPLQVPRCSLACAVVGNRLFAIGGWDGASYLASVESIDLAHPDPSWRKEPDMRTARSYSSATRTTLESGQDGGIVVMGGWDGLSSDRLDTVEFLDVRGAARSWTQLTPMRSARYGGGLVLA